MTIKYWNFKRKSWECSGKTSSIFFFLQNFLKIMHGTVILVTYTYTCNYMCRGGNRWWCYFRFSHLPWTCTGGGPGSRWGLPVWTRQLPLRRLTGHPQASPGRTRCIALPLTGRNNEGKLLRDPSQQSSLIALHVWWLKDYRYNFKHYKINQIHSLRRGSSLKINFISQTRWQKPRSLVRVQIGNSCS